MAMSHVCVACCECGVVSTALICITVSAHLTYWQRILCIGYHDIAEGIKLVQLPALIYHAHQGQRACICLQSILCTTRTMERTRSKPSGQASALNSQKSCSCPHRL